VDTAIPRAQKLIAVAVAAAVAVIVIVFHSRLSADFWPIDSSRVAPNILAGIIQWAVILVIAVLLWPPWRRRLHRFVDRKLAPIHASHIELHRKIDELAESHAAIHEKLDALAPTKPKRRAP